MCASSELKSDQHFQPTGKDLEDPPNANDLKRTFHNYATIERLSEDELKRKVCRLFLEATELSCMFNRLFTSLFLSLKRRNIAKEDLAISLIGLEMFPPIYETPKLPLFKDQKQAIEAAKDIQGIWIIVKDYCSFFNTYIIEHVTEHLGTEEDQQRMLKYHQAFEEYAKRELSDCPELLGSMNKRDCTIIVKLDDSFDDCTAKHIKILQKKLCDILKISEGALHLVQAKRGCYELIFQAPSLVKDIAFPLSEDQESRLKELGVVYLICGDYKFLSHNEVKVRLLYRLSHINYS